MAARSGWFVIRSPATGEQGLDVLKSLSRFLSLNKSVYSTISFFFFRTMGGPNPKLVLIMPAEDTAESLD